MYPLTKVSEQVNRKCLLGTRFYNFQPPHQSYHFNLATLKISTSGIAKLSMLTMAIPGNVL